MCDYMFARVRCCWKTNFVETHRWKATYWKSHLWNTPAIESHFAEIPPIGNPKSMGMPRNETLTAFFAPSEIPIIGQPTIGSPT